MPTAKKTDAEQLREQYPNAWIAVEEGDKLEGKVVGVTRAWSDARNRGTGDGFYPLLQVETDDGVILAFHAFMTVSYNRVMELQPLPGERVIVTYQGLGRAKEGMNAPKLFHIQMPDRDPEKEAHAVYGKLSGDRNVADAAKELQQVFPGATEEHKQDSLDDIPWDAA